MSDRMISVYASVARLNNSRSGRIATAAAVLLFLVLTLPLAGCSQHSGSVLAPYVLLPQTIGPDGDRDILLKGRISHKASGPLFFDRTEYDMEAEEETVIIRIGRPPDDGEQGEEDADREMSADRGAVFVRRSIDEETGDHLYEYLTRAHVIVNENHFYFNPAENMRIHQDGFDIAGDMTFSARVAPGVHKVRVYAPYFKPYETIVETRGRGEVDFQIKLEPVDDYQPNYYRQIVAPVRTNGDQDVVYWEPLVHFMGGRLKYSDWSGNIRADDQVIRVYFDEDIAPYKITGRPPIDNLTRDFIQIDENDPGAERYTYRDEELETAVFWIPEVPALPEGLTESRLRREAQEAFLSWQRESGQVWFETVDSPEDANIVVRFARWISSYDEDEEEFSEDILGFVHNPADWRGRWQPEVWIALNKCSVSVVEEARVWRREFVDRDEQDDPGGVNAPRFSWAEGPDRVPDGGDFIWDYDVHEIISVGAAGDSSSLLTQSERTHVMLHEFGHALGLSGHSLNASDIMYSRLVGAPWFSGPVRAPSQADINTLKMLYQTVPFLHELGFVVPVDRNVIFPPD